MNSWGTQGVEWPSNGFCNLFSSLILFVGHVDDSDPCQWAMALVTGCDLDDRSWQFEKCSLASAPCCPMLMKMGTSEIESSASHIFAVLLQKQNILWISFVSDQSLAECIQKLSKSIHMYSSNCGRPPRLQIHAGEWCSWGQMQGPRNSRHNWNSIVQYTLFRNTMCNRCITRSHNILYSRMGKFLKALDGSGTTWCVAPSPKKLWDPEVDAGGTDLAISR